MAIAVYFNPASMSATQYDEVMEKLETAGSGTPTGRLLHSSFGSADHLMVYDIWESEEAFGAFGEALMPILAEIGLDVGQPEIMPLHNMID